MANFPCQADLVFYNSKRTPVWALRMEAKAGIYRTSGRSLGDQIDAVVNAHAGVRPTRGEMAAGNLLVLIGGYLKRRGDLVDYLTVISVHPECAQNPEKRAAFAKKWARKLSQVRP